MNKTSASAGLRIFRLHVADNAVHDCATYQNRKLIPTEFPDNDRYERLPMQVVDTIARFKEKPLEFAPGDRFHYSDSGYLSLGYIIEQASGEKYEDFIRKNIYEPLHMQNSGYDHPWIVLKHRAQGYS